MVDTAGQVRHTGTACLLIIEMGTKVDHSGQDTQFTPTNVIAHRY